jgi:hypothetical protein
MKIALYIGIAGVVLAILYYFYHISRRKAASSAKQSGMREQRVRELTRAPTVAEKAAMSGRFTAKVKATQNRSNLSMFY